MTNANDFKVGDRVENSYGAHGKVEAVKDGAVHVRFSDRGGGWTGIYDADWFSHYPGMLKNLERRTRSV